MTRWFRLGPWWILTALMVLPLFRLLVTMKIRNGSHLPGHGPFIIAPNHYSEIDPVVMGVAVWRLGRTPRFLAKASLFKVPFLGFYLRRTGQIPVERQAGSLTTPFDAAHRLIDSGQGVIVYPEGTLTREPDLWPMKGKTGAVRMALEAGIPLYPAAHWGTQNLMPRYGKGISVFPRPRIEVLVGPPLDLSMFEGRPITRELLAEATDRLMLAIQNLSAELRGEEPPAEIYAPQSIEPGRKR